MAISTLFFGGLLAILFVLALINPLCGILGYLYVYLIYNPQLWWSNALSTVLTRPSLAAVLFLIGGCVLHLDRIQWRVSRREIEFYIFLGVMWVVSIFFGEEMHDEAWMALEKMTKTIVFIFLLIRVVHNQGGVKTVVWGLISGALLMAYQAHVTGEYFGMRLENIGGLDFREANALALFMACGCVFLGLKMLRAPWWGKVLSVLGIALMMNTLILTRSRAGFLGLLFAVPYALFATPKRHRRQVYVGAILGGILLFVLADDYFMDRMYTIRKEFRSIQLESQSDHEARFLNRLDFWRDSVRIFKDHPLGIGVRNFQRLVPSYDPRNPGTDAHNTYVICYTEIGIVGIILFVLIVGGALVQLRRVSAQVRDRGLEGDMDVYAVAIFSALLVYLLGGMTTHTYLYHEITWILLALPICMENAVTAEES